MIRRRAMCPTCPWKGGVAKAEGWDEIVRDVLAAGEVGDAPFPCHEDNYTDDPNGVACRGNAEGTRILKRMLAERQPA